MLHVWFYPTDIRVMALCRLVLMVGTTTLPWPAAWGFRQYGKPMPLRIGGGWGATRSPNTLTMIETMNAKFTGEIMTAGRHQLNSPEKDR